MNVLDLKWKSQIENEKKYRFLKELHAFATCSSTSDIAGKLAKEGAPSGTVVVARTQVAGRGREGRLWLSPEGSLAMSVVIRPPINIELAPRLTFFTAQAVLNALSLLGATVRVKWPNDLLLADGKVCGILVDAASQGQRLDYAVIGIGVNVLRPPEFASQISFPAAFLSDEIQQVSLNQVLGAILEALEVTLASPGDNLLFEACLSQLREASATLGQHVSVRNDANAIAGEAIDFNADGSLLLRVEDGSLKTVYAGDIWPS